MGDVLEAAVAPAVAGDIGRREVADRQRRRTPELARVVVPQIERLARAIGHRIVRPRRDLVLAAVDRPGVAAAFCADLEAERRIGDDVDPRRRRRLARPQDRHIFPSVSREAAEPVEEFEVGRARPSAASSNAATVGFGAALAGAAGSAIRSSCSNSLPRWATSTTRATEARRSLVSAEIRSARNRKTRPGRALRPRQRRATGSSAPESRSRSEVPGRRRTADRSG